MIQALEELLSESREVLASEPQRSLSLAQEALALCQEQDLDPIAALIAIGIAYCKLFQDRLAQKQLTSVLAMPGLKDADKQDILRYLPYSYYRSGDFEQCLSYALEALGLARELGTLGPEARAENDVANAYFASGSYQLALEHYLASYRLNQQQTDAWQMAIVLNGLAMTYQALGFYSKAVEFFKQSLHERRKIGNRYGEAICLFNLGKRYLESHDLPLAVTHVEQSLKIFADLKDNTMHAHASIILAEVFRLQSRENDAKTCLDEVLAVPTLAKDTRALGLFGLAKLAEQQGKLMHARQHMVEAIKLATALGMQQRLAEFHRYLSSLYEKNHDLAKALSHFQRYHEFVQITQGKQAQQRANLLMIQFETEQARKDSEIYRLKNIELVQMVQELQAVHQQLQDRNASLEYLNAFDPLTQMMNRRAFSARIEEAFEQSKKQGFALTVLMCDVDNFKHINDNFSHHVGDRVLRTIGELMRAQDQFVLARYGGEEFAGFAKVPLELGVQHCEHLRHNVEHYAWQNIHPDLRVTVSMGISGDTSVPDYEKMLSLADRQLYRAKNTGKNRLAYEKLHTPLK